MALSFGETGERLRRSTVQVFSPGGYGSGVVWSADGIVITNAHVVQGDRTLVETWDGRRLPATVFGRDLRCDLIRLRMDTQLEAVLYRDSGGVRPGELVIAVGSPLGFTGALSTGVVHAVGPLAGFGRRRWVQASVRLAPGNSGGPLADARGRVIGINTMVAHGLALAIPSDTVGAFMRSAINPVKLGVTVRPVPAGLLVLEVEPGSAASTATLLAGDILVGAGGKPIETLDDLPDALEEAHGPVRIQFLRGDRTRLRETTVRVP
jgi:serine protease Do